MGKICTKCNEEKAEHLFRKSRCKDCCNEENRVWNRENKDRIREERKSDPSYIRAKRNRLLKRKFDITIDDYDNMLFNQNNRCSICLKHQDEFKALLAVDHCHKTNKVRGLLCMNCNTALGGFGDDLARLQRAIEYLAK